MISWSMSSPPEGLTWHFFGGLTFVTARQHYQARPLVMRDVDQAERRISDHEDAINSLQVKIDKKLNIYQLRDDLERADSSLVLVPASAIEVIPAYPAHQVQAQATDPPTPVAQRSP